MLSQPPATPVPISPISPTVTPQPAGPVDLTQTDEPTAHAPDLAALQRLMLDLVNADRAAAGMAPVAWDELAARVGTTHAQEMAEHGYLSHWNLAGEGPDVRYGRAGGTEAVQENVYMFWYRYEDGRPAPIEDWELVVREAQAALMDSAGHRANILAPEHTHVGIGMAYDASTGDVRITQEFINRYIALASLPLQAAVGDTVVVEGHLLGGVSSPLINLAHEPFPRPLSLERLQALDTYESPAQFFRALEPAVDGAGRFSAQVTLDAGGQAGIYHVRIWVDVGGHLVQAAGALVDVVE